MLDANLPTKQALHTAPWPVAAEYRPVAHPMQLVEADAPVVVKYWPAAQAVHTVSPVLDANWPTKHALHCAPWPEAAEYRPVAHPMQLADVDAPVVVRYRPAAQAVHVTVPVAVAY